MSLSPSCGSHGGRRGRPDRAPVWSINSRSLSSSSTMTSTQSRSAVSPEPEHARRRSARTSGSCSRGGRPAGQGRSDLAGVLRAEEGRDDDPMVPAAVERPGHIAEAASLAEVSTGGAGSVTRISSSSIGVYLTQNPDGLLYTARGSPTRGGRPPQYDVARRASHELGPLRACLHRGAVVERTTEHAGLQPSTCMVLPEVVLGPPSSRPRKPLSAPPVHSGDVIAKEEAPISLRILETLPSPDSCLVHRRYGRAHHQLSASTAIVERGASRFRFACRSQAAVDSASKVSEPLARLERVGAKAHGHKCLQGP